MTRFSMMAALTALVTVAGSTVPAVLGTAAAGAAASSIYCSPTRDPRQPVLLVHGFNSGPQTWNDSILEQIARAGAATCIDVFDYARYSGNWVTDPHIGPALASRIDTLSAASKIGGGTGKVIVVAHSMGGLATRCAAAPSCNGGRNDVAGHLRELISFGTPNLGSWLVGPGLHDVGRTVGSLFSAACYLSFNGANPICQEIRNLGTSDATRAFKPDSDQLRALPQLPSSIPVYALAGQIEIYSSFFGLNEADLGDGGDTIVLEDSATAVARKVNGIGGEQVINCGKFDLTDWPRYSHSCWHGTETNDTRFLAAAAHQIALAESQDQTGATGSGLWSDPHLVITGHSLGAVQRGMTSQQAQAAAGVELTSVGDGVLEAPVQVTGGTRLTDALGGLCLDASSDNPAAAGTSVATPDGVLLGDPMDKVRALYGGRARDYSRTTNTPGPGNLPGGVVVMDSSGILFFYGSSSDGRSGTIVSIHSSTDPDRASSLFC